MSLLGTITRLVLGAALLGIGGSSGQLRPARPTTGNVCQAAEMTKGQQALQVVGEVIDIKAGPLGYTAALSNGPCWLEFTVDGARPHMGRARVELSRESSQLVGKVSRLDLDESGGTLINLGEPEIERALLYRTLRIGGRDHLITPGQVPRAAGRYRVYTRDYVVVSIEPPV